MNPKQLRLAILIIAGLLFTTLAWAGIPKTISYQSYLKQTNGSPVNSPTKIRFSLYSSNPHRDNPIWRETQTNVDVKQGVYSVQLGSVEPITAPFDIRYWLGVAVNDGTDMLPLQPLSSVPYSIKSGCNPGDMINCYTGTPGTMDTGICRQGLRTCLPDGSGYTLCIGEVVPAAITGCNFPNCADMAKNLNETDVDCGGSCAPCVAGKVCLIAADCESLNCLNSICSAVAPTCADMNRNGTETDIDCGGLSCGRCAIGNHCVANSDCLSQICQDSFCVANPCLDGVKNNKESDVDCGGGTCQTCQNGKTCNLNFDCQSGVCSNGICATPTCNDAVKNGNETDVDCGGICQNKCSVSKICIINADCQSEYCSNGFCAAPMCSDGVKNGNETDVDCGGNCASCSDGKTCVAPTDCQSGSCVGGTCTSVNLCAGVTCTAMDQCHIAGTCNPATGTCSNPAKANGTACNDGNACTQSDTCQAGICTGGNPVSCNALDLCHDTGTCNPATGICSNPNKADGTVCGSGLTCQSGTCLSPQGMACALNSQCSSGFCVDSVCCNVSCNGTCQACNLAGLVGTCSNIPNGTDPGNECADQGAASCGTSGSCNGSGACAFYPNGTLSVPASCSGSTLTLASTCNGAGTPVSGGTSSCSPYTCLNASSCRINCSASADCVGGFYCSNTSCVAKLPNGAECIISDECLSGTCTNSRCQ